MKTSPEGIAALVRHEGVVPAPYLDSVGVWTYGVGHTAAAGEPIPASMTKGMPTDLEEGLKHVFEVFRNDLSKYEADVLRAVKVPLAQHEFDALVSFHFNTGGIFRAQITQHLNRGDRKKAGEAFMGWTKPAEIIPRRKEEQALFLTGKYPTGGATVWGATSAGRVVWKAVRYLSQADLLNLIKPPLPAQDTSKPNLGAFFKALMKLFGVK